MINNRCKAVAHITVEFEPPPDDAVLETVFCQLSARVQGLVDELYTVGLLGATRPHGSVEITARGNILEAQP